MVYVLYNPLADNGLGEKKLSVLRKELKDEEAEFVKITEITDIGFYLANIPSSSRVAIAGGDGTLNRFVNDIEGYIPNRDIYYYPLGSGNDFFNDVKDFADEKGFVRINDYIIDLPIIKVNGLTRRFINGIGYGIDGYCCEEGDRKKRKSKKRINYTIIAVKGLAYDYHAVNAEITVDGVKRNYERVYLAPTMNGRYFGGGMMIAPFQDRLCPDRSVTSAVAFGCGRLRILTAFPSIFKGKHVKYKKLFQSFKGHEITVKFDRPTALQIDGETVSGVTEYSVLAGRGLKIHSGSGRVLKYLKPEPSKAER